MDSRFSFLRILVILLLVSSTGCQRKNLEIRIFNDLETRCNVTSHCTVTLTRYTNFAWDRFYVFEGSKFSKADIEKVIGTTYPDEPDAQKVWAFTNQGSLVFHQSSPLPTEQQFAKSIEFESAYDSKAGGYASYPADTTFEARVKTTKNGSHYYVLKPIK